MPTRLHRRLSAFRRLDGSRLGPLSEGGLISSFHLRVGAGSSELPSPSLGREGKVVCLTLPYYTLMFALTPGGWSQDSDTRAFTRLA